MLKRMAMTVVLGAVAGHACSIFPSHYEYDTLSNGDVRVMRVRTSENIMTGQPITLRDTLGLSQPAEFRAYMESSLQDSSLVFIATIDSVIASYRGDTVVPGLTPAVNLGSVSSFDDVGFYARFVIDTIFKGQLPPSPFWASGTLLSSGMCGYAAHAWKGRRFLNASGGFSTMAHLKLPQTVLTEFNRPSAHWFDGRYLVSPEFPGLRLDITEILSDYPATNVLRRNVTRVPMRPDGRAYLPDGRRVHGDGESGRTGPVPVIRR